MYRYVRKTPLDTGIKYGDILKDDDLKEKTIKKFLVSGTLVRITTPPLSEIPTFEKRSQELIRVGIETIEDLTNANPNQVAKKTRKSVVTIRRWQSEAMQWLVPDDEKEDN